MRDNIAINSHDQRFVEVQALLIALLSEVDRMCRHEGLNYALFFDSLWGALCYRNLKKGSENAHIVLMREDYDTLLEILSSGRLNPRFLLELPGGEEQSIRPYARLYCKKTDVHRVPEFPLHNNFFPVSLSILPLDSIAASDAAQAKRLRRIHAWTEALRLKGPAVDSVSEVGRSGDGTLELKEQHDLNIGQANLSAFEAWFKSLLPRRLAISRREKLMRGKPSDRSDHYAIYQPMSGLIGAAYGERQQIFPVASIPLGKKAYSCPGKAHEVLTQLYGDYRCDIDTEDEVRIYAAFDIDINYWADVIYADDPADVL